MTNPRFPATEQFLASIQAEPAPNPQSADEPACTPTSARAQEDSLPPACGAVLVPAAQEPFLPVSTIYERAQLSRVQGGRVLRQIEADGLARVHRFPTGNRGGAYKLLEITDKGWQRLAVLGLHPPKPCTHGGWEHDLAARAIQAVSRPKGFDVQFEQEIRAAGVRFDIVLRGQQGDLVYVNVGVSEPKREASAIQRALDASLHEQGTIVLIARDRPFQKQIENQLAQLGVAAERVAKLRYRLLGAVIHEYLTLKGIVNP